MYKIAILGCENSHADGFLKDIYERKIVDDVEVVGVYSEEREAAEKLHQQFGVAVADDYADFVGKVDGIMITARHGDNHYKYAKPYIASGIPMFIDKPVTCTVEDAKAFRADLEAYNVQVCGGSGTVLNETYLGLQKEIADAPPEKIVLGGYLRAPVNIEEEYGGFYFYAQHLVQMMTGLFGIDPRTVKVYDNSASGRLILTCVVRYDRYDVTLCYVEKTAHYIVTVNYHNKFSGGPNHDGVPGREFLTFYRLLQGEPQAQSYEEFFAPVYIMQAIEKAWHSGKEEPIVFE